MAKLEIDMAKLQISDPAGEKALNGWHDDGDWDDGDWEDGDWQQQWSEQTSLTWEEANWLLQGGHDR